MQINSTSHIQPMIKAIADSSHYLVGAIDSDDNFIGLGQVSAEVFHSLVAAKTYLRAHHITSALLEFENAYDEMCGLPQSNSYRQRISL